MKIQEYQTNTNLLKDLSDSQIDILKEMIEEINQEIVLRKDVSVKALKKFDDMVNEISNQLMEMPKMSRMQQHSGFGDIVKAMTELKKQKITIEEAKNQEKISVWRDIANLKREQRILIREFREKESKDSILDELIEQ